MGKRMRIGSHQTLIAFNYLVSKDLVFTCMSKLSKPSKSPENNESSGRPSFVKSRKQLSFETLNRLFKRKMREQFKLMRLKNILKETDIIDPSFNSLNKQYKEQVAIVKNIKYRMDKEITDNVDALDSLKDV